MNIPQVNPLGAVFLDSCSRFPDRIAIKTPKAELSYAQLQGTVTELARNLLRIGVGRGSRVGLKIEALEGELPISVLALTLLGAQWIKYGDYLNGHPSIKLTHLLHDDPKRPVERFSIFLKAVWPKKSAGGETPQFEGYASAEDTWFVPSSSGTTGTGKSMAVSCRALVDRISRLREYPGESAHFSAADIFLPDSNLSCLHFLHTISLGGSYVFSYDYRYLLAQDVQLIVASPAQLAELIANIPPPEEAQLKEVRVVGGALLPGLLARLLQYFKAVRASYGSTETGPVSSKIFYEYTTDLSLGTCYPDVTVEIVDESGVPLGPETEGIIRIQASGQVDGYVPDRGIPVDAFRDGWFYPGDRGRLSAAGELYVSGREQDVLNIAGVKLNIADIDRIMQSESALEDALCFIETDSNGVESLAAALSLSPAADKKQVVKAIVSSILAAGYSSDALPKNFYQLDNIPRNANGKAMRHEVSAITAGLKVIARVGK